jgi:pyruvate formate lyase activating enzyme
MKAVLFERKGENIRCLACNHYCLISEGRRGICGVRENQKGSLKLLVYGKAVASHVDPIEKKPLYHFLPGTKAFSVGTVGCNFSCDFCQNYGISQSPKGGEVEGEELPPERIVEICLGGDIPTIAYTYNEPAIFFEYAYDTAKLAKEKGIKNVFVSNGFESKEAMEMIKPYLDGINIDLKSFSPDFYRKVCKARIEPVLENIRKVHQEGVWLEVTTLVITGRNDSDKELREIAEFIASVNKSIPWHVSRFHPDYKMLDTAATSHETLAKAYEIGKEAGLKYVYVGNIPDSRREATHCPKCEKMLITREGFLIDKNKLRNGKCDCGEEIEGVWK